jgi:hypothetical protein
MDFDPNCKCAACVTVQKLLARPDFIAHYGEGAKAAAKAYTLAGVAMAKAALKFKLTFAVMRRLVPDDSDAAIEEWLNHAGLYASAAAGGVSDAEIVDAFHRNPGDTDALKRAVDRHL